MTTAQAKLEMWKRVILDCHADSKQLERLAETLLEHEQAKQILRDKGYGWTGLSLVETVKLVGEASND